MDISHEPILKGMYKPVESRRRGRFEVTFPIYNSEDFPEIMCALRFMPTHIDLLSRYCTAIITGVSPFFDEIPKGSGLITPHYTVYAERSDSGSPFSIRVEKTGEISYFDKQRYKAEEKEPLYTVVTNEQTA